MKLVLKPLPRTRVTGLVLTQRRQPLVLAIPAQPRWGELGVGELVREQFPILVLALTPLNDGEICIGSSRVRMFPLSGRDTFDVTRRSLSTDDAATDLCVCYRMSIYLFLLATPFPVYLSSSPSLSLSLATVVIASHSPSGRALLALGTPQLGRDVRPGTCEDFSFAARAARQDQAPCSRPRAGGM